MKFFVGTVLESEGEYVIAGDVFFIKERKVRIAGVEHVLHYGDIVQHGDFAYCINEDSVAERFDNSFSAFWDLKQGWIPEDDKRYYIFEDRETIFEPAMEALLGYAGRIVSRDEIGITIHPFIGEKLYNESTGCPYSMDLEDLGLISKNEYDLRVEEHKQSELQNIVEDEQLIETVAGKVPTPKDGKDGEHGSDGIDGQDGDTGQPGRDGERGLAGKMGPVGESGDQGIGTTGKQGRVGPQGRQGIPGKSGTDGSKGIQGLRGPKGDPGEPGTPGEPGVIERHIVISETEEIKTISIEEWNRFQKQDRLYKSRLNTQLGSLGGGGSDSHMEGRDVTYVDSGLLANGQFLVYDSVAGKFGLTDKDGLFGGPGGDTVYPVYIQNTAPVTAAPKYMWIETAIGGDADCFGFWFEDGL